MEKGYAREWKRVEGIGKVEELGGNVILIGHQGRGNVSEALEQYTYTPTCRPICLYFST